MTQTAFRIGPAGTVADLGNRWAASRSAQWRPPASVIALCEKAGLTPIASCYEMPVPGPIFLGRSLPG